jgi:hypothetical protein
LRPRRIELAAALTLAVTVGGVSTMACGTSDGSGSSSSSGASSSGVTPVDGGVADVDLTPRLQPERCNGLVPSQRVVSEVALSGDPPAPAGGAVSLGTYDIDQLEAYRSFDAGTPGVEQPSAGLTGRTVSATLVLTQDTLGVVEAYGSDADGGGLAAPSVRAYAYYPIHGNIYAAEVCPEAIPTKAIPYTAVGDTLSLFIDATHREVFRRRLQ